MRAYDGQQSGVRQREIASAVFGRDLVLGERNGRSDFLRNRIQRLLR
ncbi:DUF2285 domain-containing protein [Asticcacaulis benevestitus]|nr:DUF2285 domain-containing protein [Asticcacaulis benevestitus]